VPAKSGRNNLAGQLARRQVIAGGVAGGVGIAAGVGAASWLGRNPLPSDLEIGGVRLGGMTAGAGRAKLERAVAGWLAAPIRFSANQGDWTPTAADVGLRANYRDVFVEAVRVPGRGGTHPITFELEESKLRGWLDGLGRTVLEPPVDATIDFRGGQPRVHRARSGSGFDPLPALAALRAGLAAGRLEQQQIPLTQIAVDPAISDSAAESALGRARELVSAPVNIGFAEGAGGWQIDQLELMGALTVTATAGTLRVGFDPEALPTLNEIDSFISRPGTPGDIEFDPETARVSQFELPVQGRRLDRQGLVGRMAADLTPDTRQVEAPVVYDPLTWTNPLAEQLGIVAKLAEGNSTFLGSAGYRIHNIDVGSEHIDGTLVMPGETLSFNEALGPIEYDRGFVDGLVILADATEFAIGGGICQVSTTLFRAAFWAGLPVLERHKHLYRVYYYELGGWPIGFDASIWQPQLDMRFVNDTPGALLITRRFDRRRQTLAFDVWGTPDGRQVEMADARVSAWVDQPEDEWVINPELPAGTIDQTEHGARGAYASIERRVQHSEEEIRQAVFHSSFVAWPNRYMIATDVARSIHPEEYISWLKQVGESSDGSLLHRFQRPIAEQPPPLAAPESGSDPVSWPTTDVEPQLLAQIRELESAVAELIAAPAQELG
jgi:vancomycin resistance protein YoaR